MQSGMAKGLCEGDDAEAARAMPPPRPRLVGPHHTPHAAAGIVSVPPLLPRSSTDGLGTGGSAATRSMDSVAVHMEGACGSASGLSHEASDCHGSARGGEEVEGKRRVDSGEDDDCLPPNWKTVPSRSRPGQHSYVHVPTGLKQSKRPSEDPTEEAVEAFRVAVANAKRQKIARTKPLLANEATASWQAYLKNRAKKRERERKRERGGI